MQPSNKDVANGGYFHSCLSQEAEFFTNTITKMGCVCTLKFSDKFLESNM